MLTQKETTGHEHIYLSNKRMTEGRNKIMDKDENASCHNIYYRYRANT